MKQQLQCAWEWAQVVGPLNKWGYWGVGHSQRCQEGAASLSPYRKNNIASKPSGAYQECRYGIYNGP